ncbi:MAG: lytic transglycosylase domain-containing protein [Rhodocyclaceae bacterium]|jgi:soluble lytic murein transglycosylase|nr:lytic transglycosylase domain-containing protein [Rhodocyclaceae bacterium]
MPVARLPLAALLAGLLLALPRAGMANLYGFEDENGVAHFSDAPSDRRHRLLLREGRPGQRAVAPGAPSRPAQLAPLIAAAARHARVDPALVEAVARAESGFNPAALSPRGARGLMQLMPATARRYGVDDPFDPAQNLLGGARYLRDLLDRYASLPLALAAYNAGEGAVERHGNAIPPYAETLAYVPRVLDHYSRLRATAPIISW